MKLGNISFNKEAYQDITWEDFRKQFRGKLQGYDLGKAYIALTGRKPEKPVKDEVKPTVDKPKKGKSKRGTSKGSKGK